MSIEFTNKVKGLLKEASKEREAANRLDPPSYLIDSVLKKYYRMIYAKKRIEMLERIIDAPEYIRIKNMTQHEIEEYKYDNGIPASELGFRVKQRMYRRNKNVFALYEHLLNDIEKLNTQMMMYSGVATDPDKALDMAKKIIDYKKEKKNLNGINLNDGYIQHELEILENKKQEIIALIPEDVMTRKFWNIHVQEYTTTNLEFLLERIAICGVYNEEIQLLKELDAEMSKEKETENPGGPKM